MKFFNSKILQLTLMLILLIGCVFLLFNSKDPNTIISRAAAMQGAASITLLFVTWLSINRSDEQIKISNEILRLEYNHYLSFSLEEDFLRIANLSRLPIYLLDVRYEILTIRVINFSVGKNIILEAGTSQDFRLDGIYTANEPDDQLRYEPQDDLKNFQRELDSEWQKRWVSISYLYAGTADKKYTKLFSIRPEAIPWRSEEPITWLPILVPEDDYDISINA